MGNKQIKERSLCLSYAKREAHSESFPGMMKVPLDG